MNTVLSSNKKGKKAQHCTQADFGRAGKSSKLIRDAFHRHLFNLRDNQLSGRFLSKVYDVLRSDATHAYGSLTVAAGKMQLLEGFDFNPRKPLYKVFNAPFSVTINRSKGQCLVDIPLFDPVYDLRYEGRITHFKVVAAAALLDFRGMQYSTFAAESDYQAIQQPTTISLPISLPARKKLPIAVVMGIEFYQLIGGRYHLMQQGGPKSLTIVKTDQAGLNRD